MGIWNFPWNFPQAFPLRRLRRVRGEGIYLGVDEATTGSRRDTQNARVREKALEVEDDVTVSMDDGTACQITDHLSVFGY